MTDTKILIESDLAQRFIGELNKREKVMLRQGEWGEVEASKSRIGYGYGRPFTITPEAFISGELPSLHILPKRKIVRFALVVYNDIFNDEAQGVLFEIGLNGFEPIYYNAIRELVPAYFKL